MRDVHQLRLNFSVLTNGKRPPNTIHALLIRNKVRVAVGSCHLAAMGHL